VEGLRFTLLPASAKGLERLVKDGTYLLKSDGITYKTIKH
jgi:hypothetical protein